MSEFLRKNNIKVLNWPGNSPDLNPIENLWTYMKDKVAKKQPSNAEALRTAIKEVWLKEITAEYCESLVSSMPQRLQACSHQKQRWSYKILNVMTILKLGMNK